MKLKKKKLKQIEKHKKARKLKLTKKGLKTNRKISIDKYLFLFIGLGQYQLGKALVL